MKCWMNSPFLGEDLARKIVIENTNALAETFEPVEVVKGDPLYAIYRQGRRNGCWN